MNRIAALCVACVALSLPAVAEAQSRGRLVEVLRVGAEDGPDALTSISAILLSSDSLLYVAQPTEQHIRVFSSSGQPIRTIGGRGQGPGEYQAVDRLTETGGELAVYDSKLGRLSILSPQGDVRVTVGAVPARLTAPLSPRAPVARLETGSLVVIPAAGRGDQTDSLPILLVDSTLAHVLAVPGRLAWKSRTVRVPVESNGEITGRSPIESGTLWTPHPRGKGLAILEQERPADRRGRFRIMIVDAPGRTRMDRTYAFNSQRLSRTDAAYLVDELTDRWWNRLRFIQPTDRAGLRQRVRDAMALPDYLPLADRLVLGADGSIWLREQSVRASASKWHALDPAGSPLGWVLLPSSDEVHYATAASLIVASTEALDVPVLVRYRVEFD